MQKVTLRISGVAFVLVALVCGALWYDEAPDAQIHERYLKQSRLPDEDNLYLALVGANFRYKPPVHELGRTFLSDKTVKMEKGALPKDHANFYAAQNERCHPLPPPAGGSCYIFGLRADELDRAEDSLSERYRSLRKYTAFASIPDSESGSVAFDFVNMRRAYMAAYLAAGVDKFPIEELVADTLFLRRAMALGDSLIAKMIFANALGRNYRLATEIVLEGTTAQAAALKPMLEPLPGDTINLATVLPGLYMEQVNGNKRVRRALLLGENPFAADPDDDRNAKIPESAWKRVGMGLQIKPVYHVNRQFESVHAIKAPGSRSGPWEALMDYLDSASEGLLPGISPGWHKDYEAQLHDLSRYIDLISIAANLSQGATSFDLEQVLKQSNQQATGNPPGRQIKWDRQNQAFSFAPVSKLWRWRAEKANTGVLVYPPKDLPIEAEEWEGYRASCSRDRCMVARDDGTTYIARRGALLGRETLGWRVERVAPGKFVEISSIRQLESGTWFVRSVRLKAS